jgi:hypothetical protein
VENKPEVKKAGGVFYTPSYIVQYIVKNTVGKLLEGKTPCQIAGLCILDPACGSGSFLIDAYQYLLDWHRDWYVQHLRPLIEEGEKMSSPRLQRLLPPDDSDSGRGGSLVERIAGKRGKKGRRAGTDSSSLGLRAPSLPIYMAGNGEWKLTTGEKKRILLSSIYGVDIDAQAVEVTKLSLHLKVLEEESDTTISAQLTLFSERALPDLSRNIKCGNSLIGPDYYEGHEQEKTGLDLEERLSVNAFDWQREFPGVFQRGGFDAVIGNPPYVRQEGLGRFKEYFAGHYRVYHGVADLYAYFIERGVSLLRPAGLFSYIVANKWMRANYGQPLRAWLKGQHIEEIIDFGDLPVFARATTYPCILRISREAPAESFSACQVKSLDFSSLSDYVDENRYEIRQTDLDDSGWSLADEKTQALLDKLKGAGVPLGEYVQGKIYYGIKTGLNEAFVIDGATRERLIAEDPKSAELIKPFLAGRDIKRYEQPRSDKYLILMPRGWTREKSGSAKDALGWLKRSYPAIANHLLPFAQAAEKRFDKGEHWWELRACDYYHEFEKPKFFWPEIAGSARFTFDDSGYYANNKTYLIPVADLYLLGLLNSALLRLFIHSVSTDLQGDSFNFSAIFVDRTPILRIDASRPEDVARHDRLVSLVEQMLQMHRLLAAARTGHERTALERQIEATDGQIDRLVYELYGLTEEEIGIVEAASS